MTEGHSELADLLARAADALETGGPWSASGEVAAAGWRWMIALDRDVPCLIVRAVQPARPGYSTVVDQRVSAQAARHPNAVEFVVDADRTRAWLAKGARPSETVERLLKSAGILLAAK